MQAKERRSRHFNSSVGLMLNENYGDGLIPNTVQSQDFLYVPATDIPTSGPALAFLRERLQEPHPHKPRSIGTSDSLYQAYRRAFGQPVGMVHYDRDPCYWQGKDRPGSDFGSSAKSLSSSRLRDYDAIFNGYQKGPVPNMEPASTVKSVSTAKSSARSAATQFRPASNARTTARSRASTKQYGDEKLEHSGSGYGVPVQRSKISSGRVEANRHRLWTPGTEAAGFKPYSPFSDSLEDFGKMEAKYIAPEIKPEVDRTCDVLPAPVYADALDRMLDNGDVNCNNNNYTRNNDNNRSSPSKDGKRSTADVLKLHGNPEYPAKVMEDKDVPNYVAWAKIFPYCPLTQVKGQEKPVFVPPRGFTPSTPSVKPGCTQKLRDVKKEKRKILEGIKLLSASSSKTRRAAAIVAAWSGPKRATNGESGINTETKGEIHPSLRALPPSLAAKLNPSLKQDGGVISGAGRDAYIATNTNNTTTRYNNNNDKNSNGIILNNNAPSKQEPVSTSNMPTGSYDPHATRKFLDMKMKAPIGWYGGQTPTHTPTPEPSLPIKGNRAWLKHHSPARVRRFLRAIGGDAPTPEPEQY